MIITEWGISVGGHDPMPADLFATREAAADRLWREGGEQLMVRHVTPWREADEARQ